MASSSSSSSSSPLRLKSVQRSEELPRFYSGNTRFSLRKRGFVKYNYSWRNHHFNQLCHVPRFVSSAAAVVNHDSNLSTDSCSSNLSVFNHYFASKNSRSIFPTKKKLIDKEENNDDDDDVSGKLDRWVKESVTEILKNLDEAPFLVHIYSDGEEESASNCKTRLVKEKASAESWPQIKVRWGGESATPSGIILVEEMGSEDDVRPDGENQGGLGKSKDSCSASTKVWGIVIQGKGLSWPACYILKTSRVRGVSGFCTHFCLIRVKCFFETVDIQLKKLWLV